MVLIDQSFSFLHDGYPYPRITDKRLTEKSIVDNKLAE